MRALMWVVVDALALAAATWLLGGITLSASDQSSRVLALVVVAVLFGLVNAVVKPVVKFVAFPFVLLTLGLLVFAINALMLLLTSWLAGLIGLGFHVEGFWTALVGALVVSVATWLLALLLPDPR